MENVIDLIANTCVIYINHCSNCKNTFTSLVYKTYLNTKHSDRNAKEINIYLVYSLKHFNSCVQVWMSYVSLTLKDFNFLFKYTENDIASNWRENLHRANNVRIFKNDFFFLSWHLKQLPCHLIAFHCKSICHPRTVKLSDPF